jgi:hypothetical protein
MNSAFIYFPTLDKYAIIGTNLSLSESTGTNKLGSKNSYISNKLKSILFSKYKDNFTRDDLDKAEIITVFDSNKLIYM